MELALILLLLTLIVAVLGWAVFAGINRLDQASAPAARTRESTPVPGRAGTHRPGHSGGGPAADADERGGGGRRGLGDAKLLDVARDGAGPAGFRP